MSMQGKRVVITGASSGIGRTSTLALARQGADLSLVVRDRAKGEAVAAEVRALGVGNDVRVFLADLASLVAVRRVGEELAAAHASVDVLLNNAGGVYSERITTVDGYETTMATNHLAPFLLTRQLLPAVKKAAAGRIVNVSSEAHRQGTIDFADLMSERKPYSGFRVYCASKLANILFTTELARQLEGTTVTTNSLHPGVIASGFARNNQGIIGFGAKLLAPFFSTPEKGSRTSVFLASDPSVSGISGRYFDASKPKKPSREARDPAVARKLWKASEELVEKALG
ncbi:MAG: short-chain dehydrogenase [Labilithrix sp.]|nr:short-chain dehydrogenase [Labilithrix sp.]